MYQYYFILSILSSMRNLNAKSIQKNLIFLHLFNVFHLQNMGSPPDMLQWMKIKINPNMRSRKDPDVLTGIVATKTQNAVTDEQSMSFTN